jgi:hypothetical protein
MYVVNVSSISDICCSKCFILQVFHEQARQRGAGEGGPLRRSGPRMRVGSEAGAAAGVEHKDVSMGVAPGTEHEAAFMGGQQMRSTKLHPWIGSRHGAQGKVEHETSSIGALRVSLLK